MNPGKQVIIMGRLHDNPEKTREVVCVSSSPEALKRARSSNIVLWVDQAVQLDPPRTGVKSFDSIADKDYIGTGNVVSNVLFSSCVRSRSQTECNGFQRPRGVLQAFDLKGLMDYRLDIVAKRITAHPAFKESNGYWYVFRRHQGSERLVYGVLVTDEEHNLVFRFDREDLGMLRTAAGHKILNAMELRVTSKAWQNRTRVYQREAA